MTTAEGQDIADRQLAVIEDDWHEVCDAARLTTAQRDSLFGGPILNPFAFDPLPS